MGQCCGWDNPERKTEGLESGRRVFLPKMVIANLITRKLSDKSKSGDILLSNRARLLKNVRVIKDIKKGLRNSFRLKEAKAIW